MTLDCTNLKPGDRVRLRNGAIGVVDENDNSGIPIRVLFDENTEIGHWHKPDGKLYGRDDKDLDIIEILPPEPPTDCTSQQQAMAVGEKLAARARNQAGANVGSSITPSSSLLEVTHDFIGPKHPDAINCNGKRYVPADSPSLYTGTPFTIITHPEKGVVALRYDGIKYTPADAWPEPITDRAPTKEDEDDEGYVQLYDDGRWAYIELEQMEDREWECGWARTSRWKPKPTPAHTREEVLDMLRHDRVADLNIGDDLLASIITHLESTND